MLFRVAVVTKPIKDLLGEFEQLVAQLIGCRTQLLFVREPLTEDVGHWHIALHK
jgi:hypothetical protein